MQKLANSAWFLLILIVTLLPLDAIALPASQADVPPSSELELKPVLDLAHRVVPWMDGKLILIRIPKERGDDVFDLRTEGGKLVIRASDPSSAGWAIPVSRSRRASARAFGLSGTGVPDHQPAACRAPAVLSRSTRVG